MPSSLSCVLFGQGRQERVEYRFMAVLFVRRMMQYVRIIHTTQKLHTNSGIKARFVVENVVRLHRQHARKSPYLPNACSPVRRASCVRIPTSHDPETYFTYCCTYCSWLLYDQRASILVSSSTLLCIFLAARVDLPSQAKLLGCARTVSNYS